MGAFLCFFPPNTMVKQQPLASRIASARELAQEAFWNVIVEQFPEAASGDLSPLRTICFDQAVEDAVNEWVDNNVRDASPFDTTHHE